jgi:hypothetical protein
LSVVPFFHAAYVSRFRNSGNVEVRFAQLSSRFEKIAETNFHRLVTPDKKKYAAYDQALKQHKRLEQKWRDEDQRNLRRLVNIREFLWT